MFGKKEKVVGFASGSTTLISKSTEIVGDIKFSGNLEIEGTVRGNIISESDADARVRVMEKGLVQGEVRVPKVVINGHVEGDVHSDKHVELAARATVEGNVHYRLIEMVKGAQVNGSLLYADDKTAKKAPATEMDDSDAKLAVENPAVAEAVLPNS